METGGTAIISRGKGQQAYRLNSGVRPGTIRNRRRPWMRYVSKSSWSIVRISEGRPRSSGYILDESSWLEFLTSPG